MHIFTFFSMAGIVKKECRERTLFMNSKIILTYQLSPIQAAALSSLASSFSGTLKLRPVFPYEYAQSLGTLCGISGFPKKNRKPSAACGFDSQELDTFLAELKKGGLFTAALKAIVTPHNIFWDSQMLYQELASERASLS